MTLHYDTPPPVPTLPPTSRDSGTARNLRAYADDPCHLDLTRPGGSPQVYLTCCPGMIFEGETLSLALDKHARYHRLVR